MSLSVTRRAERNNVQPLGTVGNPVRVVHVLARRAAGGAWTVLDSAGSHGAPNGFPGQPMPPRRGCAFPVRSLPPHALRPASRSTCFAELLAERSWCFLAVGTILGARTGVRLDPGTPAAVLVGAVAWLATGAEPGRLGAVYPELGWFRRAAHGATVHASDPTIEPGSLRIPLEPPGT